ncbi:MAG: hypothetical protein AB7F86_15010 [Bdellovibrionales bacterium]
MAKSPTCGYILVKFDSFDTKVFEQRLRDHLGSGVSLVYNYQGKIERRDFGPDGVKLSTLHYYHSGGWSDTRWIRWPAFLLVMMRELATVFIEHRFRVAYLAGADVLLWWTYLFKKMGRVENITTTIEDWSLPAPGDGLFMRLNKLKIRWNDWIVERLDIRVLILNKEIHEARNRHLGPSKNAICLPDQWTWFLEAKSLPRPAEKRKFILLLGTARPQFGLDLILSVLPRVHSELGVGLKIVGPNHELYESLLESAKTRNIDHLIHFRGFVESEDLSQEISDCFCGLNLQENPINTSALAVAGRVIHYLQEFIVPVVTPHSGAVVPLIRKHSLGIVCEPFEQSVVEAIIRSKLEYDEFAMNIQRFFDQREKEVDLDKMFRSEMAVLESRQNS